ncbi:hypothetical protein B566_EDAN014307 [Ephemera danica]|nr:hypothetical protein B566_EDAN014307 [Ephemera danica]
MKVKPLRSPRRSLYTSASAMDKNGIFLHREVYRGRLAWVSTVRNGRLRFDYRMPEIPPIPLAEWEELLSLQSPPRVVTPAGTRRRLEREGVPAVRKEPYVRPVVGHSPASSLASKRGTRSSTMLERQRGK